MHVGAGKCVDISYMEPLCRGVGEHHKVVEWVLSGLQLLQSEGVSAALFPELLPLLFYGGRVVAVPLLIYHSSVGGFPGRPNR